MSTSTRGIGAVQVAILEVLATLGPRRADGWVPGDCFHTRGIPQHSVLHALAEGRIESDRTPFERLQWKESRYRLTPLGQDALASARSKRPRVAGADQRA